MVATKGLRRCTGLGIFRLEVGSSPGNCCHPVRALPRGVLDHHRSRLLGGMPSSGIFIRWIVSGGFLSGGTCPKNNCRRFKGALQLFWRSLNSLDSGPCGLYCRLGIDVEMIFMRRNVMARLDPHSYADLSQGVVNHVDWKVEVDFEGKVLAGVATLSFVDAVSREVDLDSRELTIESVSTHAGTSCGFEVEESEGFMGNRLRVTVPEATSELTFVYRTAPTASALQWLAPEHTSGGALPFLFTQCQAIHARSVLPIQDTPKARFTFHAEISVPDSLAVVMAAAPGEAHEPSGGRKSFSFDMPQPIPSYLLAFAVGNIVSKDVGPRCTVYAEPEVVEKAAWEFADADKMLQAAEGLFGKYPWERFDFLVMPPAFPYGGMENPRLTFLTPTLLAGDRSMVNVLAHELAHSWTGNLVTNATMNDFWLNEGFTVWAERRILERLEGEESVALHANIGRNGLEGALKAFAEKPQWTHLKTDLEGVDPDEAYSLVPYEKGFLFVKSMELAAGREAFDAFLLDYIKEFQFTSITTDQFVAFLKKRMPGLYEKVNADAWLYAPGIPEGAPTYQSQTLARIKELSRLWKEDGVRPPVAELKGWGAELWQLFLPELPNVLSEEECRWLDEQFDLTANGNSEILAAWLQIGARSNYAPALARLKPFLASVGRMKYVKPLYAALLAGEETAPLARQWYAEYRERYHPIAQLVLNGLFK